MTVPHLARRVSAAALVAALGWSAAPAFAQEPAAPPAAETPAAGPKTPLPAAGPKTALPAATPRAAQPGQYKPQAQNADWPCIQPKVGELSYGQVWSGPPLEEAMTKWRDDPAVADLVPVLAARRTKQDAAAAVLARFVKAEGAAKNDKLTLLFAGVFSEINGARSAVINGIERYARKQRDLSDRIKDESLKLAADRKDMATQNSPEFQQKEQARDWDTRIYDERAQAMTAVCESPVILEQLAFQRGRDIQALMD